MSTTRRGTPDFVLLFLAIALVGFGLVMVFSASYSITFSEDPLLYTKKQAAFAVTGIVVMFIVMNIPYAALKKTFVPLFLLSLLLLVLVLIFGEEVNGARSWFRFGPFGFQPTELAKIGLLAYLATIIPKKGENSGTSKRDSCPC